MNIALKWNFTTFRMWGKIEFRYNCVKEKIEIAFPKQYKFNLVKRIVWQSENSYPNGVTLVGLKVFQTISENTFGQDYGLAMKNKENRWFYWVQVFLVRSWNH